MPDAVFAHPRLAALYDALDGDRSDLDPYLALVAARGARRVLDVGCGTGTLACLLAARGVEVVGVDPAGASLAVARGKPCAERVRWVEGGLAAAPPGPFDLVAMTGNVAQVFTSDEAWRAVLAGARDRLAPGGALAFETRRPERRAWEGWTRAATFRRAGLPGDLAETWTDLVAVELPLVTFAHHFAFADGTALVSTSTLRFRSLDEVRADLAAAGCTSVTVGDAPDRPGLEHVLVAEWATSGAESARRP